MDKNNVIVACCGLVCTGCGAYKKNKCSGCFEERPWNKACKVEKCVQDNFYTTCADCTEFENLNDCKKLNNIISKFFGLINKTNRLDNLRIIKNIGLDEFKKQCMAK